MFWFLSVKKICCEQYWYDSPSSISDAARMGVIGGWSPASVPFLGRFNPVASRAFTWWRSEVIIFWILITDFLWWWIQWIALYMHMYKGINAFMCAWAHSDPHLLCPHWSVGLLLQCPFQVKVLWIVGCLGTGIADVSLCIKALCNLHSMLGSHTSNITKCNILNDLHNCKPKLIT